MLLKFVAFFADLKFSLAGLRKEKLTKVGFIGFDLAVGDGEANVYFFHVD